MYGPGSGLMKTVSSSDWNLLRDISRKELSNLGMLLRTKIMKMRTQFRRWLYRVA